MGWRRRTGGPWSDGRGRGVVTIVASVTLGAVLAACSGGGTHHPPPTTTAPTTLARPPTTPTAVPTAAAPQPSVPQPSVPQQIMTRHALPNGQVDLEGAMELFSYAFSPLPGVTLPPGTAGAPGEWTDTAMDAIVPYLGDLNPAQLKVVLPFLATGTSTSPAASAAGRAPAATLTAYSAQLDVATAQAQIQVKVQQALLDEAARLGHALKDNSKVHVVLTNVELQLNGVPAGAWTVGTNGPAIIDPNSTVPPSNVSGPATDCYIHFPPSFWQNLTWTPGDFHYDAVYHEVFHCYQDFVLGQTDLLIAAASPDWVIEGSAQWAGDSMSGFDDPKWVIATEKTRDGYLNNPRTKLDDLSHVAFGLYYEIEYLGRPLWPVWWDLWTKASVGGWGTTDWFDAIAGTAKTNLTDAWGASFFVAASLGHDWTVTAPHQTITFENVATPLSGSLAVSADPYSTYQATIPAQPPGTVVVINTTAGTPRFVDANGHDVTGGDLVVLCWQNCAPCAAVADAPVLEQVSGTVDWALTALADGGQASFTTANLQDACKPPPKPRPSPCANGCPGSNGDPHLETVNLQRYEFQAAGEYELLRSPDGSVDVQARQEPLATAASTFLAGATINTAVAARVGTHRVGVYLVGSSLEAHVDGQTVTSTTDLGNGARLVVHSLGFEVDMPDGTTLWALPVGTWGINIQIQPSATLRSTGLGLLAAYPPGADLPPLPDGTLDPYESPQTYAFTYQRLAPAWRVTDKTTLFDYTGGRSTASYNVAGFVPELRARASFALDSSQRQSAELACQAIADVVLHDDCAYDVSATGRSDLAAGYAATESFESGGTSALDATQSGPTPTFAVPLVSGATQLLASVVGTNGAALGPDGTIYAAVAEGGPGNTAYEMLAIDPAAAKIRTKVTIPAAAGLATGVAYAGGALWVIAVGFTSNGRACQLLRLDPTSLQTLATIALTGCPSASPALAAVGDAVWTQNPGVGSGPTGQLVRYDAQTTQVTAKVSVPNGVLTTAGAGTIGGVLQSSPTAVFWHTTSDTYRVRAPWTTAEDLQAGPVTPQPAGDIAAVWRDANTVDLLGGAPGSPTFVGINGNLVGADAQDLYIDRPGDGGEQLWRYPISGGAPTLAASVAQGARAAWSTVLDPRSPLIFTPHAMITVTPDGGSGDTPALFLEVVALK